MSQRTPFKRIDLETARGVLASDGVMILDVRDQGAYQSGHMDGAKNAGMNAVQNMLMTTPKKTPIFIYCYRGNASQEYAQMFSDFGFPEVYSLDGGYEAWEKAAKAGQAAPVDGPLGNWLTEHGFAGDLNATIENGMTPLMKASHQGDTTTMQALIEAGAEINAKNNDGNNALWLACVGNHADAIDTLVIAGIDIDNRNVNGATSLMYASSSSRPAMVERLILAGADLTAETPEGFTALDMAASLECLTLLRQAEKSKTQAKPA